MHLKNFSLLEINGSVNEYALAPAYDLLPVNIILKEDEEEFALTLNGKKKNITYNDFLKFSNHIGINEAVAIKIIKRTINLEEEFKKMIIDSLLSEEMKCDYINLIHLRCEKLKKIILKKLGVRSSFFSIFNCYLLRHYNAAIWTYTLTCHIFIFN